MTYQADLAETRVIQTAAGRVAYRELGPGGGTPLLLLQRYRGTIDHWDPLLLDALAAERRVVVFDSIGVGRSSGSVPANIEGMATVAADFVDSLGLRQADVMGWSMGGFVAQSLALGRPDLVRRLVVAGSGPGGAPGTPDRDARVPEIALRETNDDEDFLFLFFPDTPSARAAGLESLRRLDTRLRQSGTDVSREAFQTQLGAIVEWNSGADSAWSRLDTLEVPLLVANGAHDVMEPAFQTYAMAQRVPQSTALIYGDAGHAFLFQHASDFAHHVVRFLDADDDTEKGIRHEA